MNRTKLRSRLILLSMFLITALPLSIAWTMILNDWKPSKITANGHFLKKPIEWKNISNTTFVGENNTWRLLVIQPMCEQICQDRLESYRKMHVALGRQSNDLSRVLISSEDIHSRDNFLYQVGDDTLIPEIQKQFQNKVWLADPNGWIVMSFDSNQPASELHKDILKLLKANSRS